MSTMSSLTIDENKDRFLEYKYKITTFTISVDGKEDEIPLERIQTFKIENYYDDATFPIFKINVLLEASRYYNMLKNKDKVEIIVRLQSFYRKYNGSTLEETSCLRDVFNTKFVLFTDDENGDFEENLKKEANVQDDVNKLEELLNMTELFLFKKDWVSGLRKQVNVIMQEVDMTTAIAYLLSQAGVSDVLMSPLQNTTSYSEMVLPPQSIDKQLRYLNNNVGFHQYGTTIFFGFNNGYIIDCKGGCTAYKKKEWKESVFYVMDKANTHAYMSNMLEKPKDEHYYYNVSSSSISIYSSSVSGNVINGTEADVVDMKANSASSAKAGKANIVGDQNKTTLYNNSSNPYKATVYQAIQTGNNMMLTIAMQNVDILGLTPNKECTVVFENQLLHSKYGGTYRLSTCVNIFTGNNTEFDIVSTVVLKKTVTA